MGAVFKGSAVYGHYNACIGYTDTLEAACIGYLRAVEALLGHVISARNDLDTLFYPIVFNWRHYIELRLKTICLDLSALEAERAEIQKTHDLTRLWSRARKGLVEKFPNEDHKELACIDEHIAELARVDPNGETFRYTVDEKRLSVLPEHLSHFGYVEFAEAVKEVSEMLEGVSCMVGNARDYVNEMLSTMER